MTSTLLGLLYALFSVFDAALSNIATTVVVLAVGSAVAGLVWGQLVTRPGLLLAHRRDAGQCERCGYDLRGSPTRCPECGRPAPATAADSGPYNPGDESPHADPPDRRDEL